MDLVIAVLIVIAVQLVSYLILHGRIRQELNATDLLKNVQEEVDGMVRELNLSAERNIGLLEARIEEMETLLAQADQKIVLLSRELERRERTAELYTHLKAPVVETPVVEAPAAPEPTPEPVAGSSTPPEAEVVEWTAPRPRTLKERVLGYRDQGLGPSDIAAATGAPLGEVELILSLNPPTRA